jgi:hypothetical protein
MKIYRTTEVCASAPGLGNPRKSTGKQRFAHPPLALEINRNLQENRGLRIRPRPWKSIEIYRNTKVCASAFGIGNQWKSIGKQRFAHPPLALGINGNLEENKGLRIRPWPCKSIVSKLGW